MIFAYGILAGLVIAWILVGAVKLTANAEEYYAKQRKRLDDIESDIRKLKYEQDLAFVRYAKLKHEEQS